MLPSILLGAALLTAPTAALAPSILPTPPCARATVAAPSASVPPIAGASVPVRPSAAPPIARAILPAPPAPPILLAGDVYDGQDGPLLGGQVYHVSADIRVPPGQTLTMQAGAIVKFDTGLRCTVEGLLLVDGTAGAPVVCTSLRDDAADAGGDTNGDGSATSPMPGDWKRIGVISQDPGVHRFHHLRLRYAGSGFSDNEALRFFTSAQAEILDCEFHDCASVGLDLGFSDLSAPVERCDFQRCLFPISSVEFDRLRVLLDNTASDCVQHDHLEQDTSNPSFHTSASIGPRNLLNGVLVGRLIVDSGVVLTLEAGVVVKYREPVPTGWHSVGGTLLCAGTSGAPVVFTSYYDDTHAGDSNNDGNATTPSPGDWASLHLGGDGNHLLEHTLVRYSSSYRDGAVVMNARTTLRDCTIELSAGSGLNLGSNGASTFEDVEAERVLVRDNGGYIADRVRLDNLPHLDVVGGGNAIEAFHVIGGLSQVLDLRPEDYPGNALVYSGYDDFGSGEGLRLHAGVVLKMTTFAQFRCIDGLFEVHGTAQDPVVLTSVLDDGVGGDTNGDGNATSPAPGDWALVHLIRGAGEVHGLHLRYGGRSNQTQFECRSDDFSVHGLRSQWAQAAGARVLDHLGPFRDAVCTDNGGEGLRIEGDVEVHHSTFAGNGAAGLRRVSGSGTASHCISRSNVGAGFEGFGAADVSWSNGGFAGQNGNIDVDPHFTDAANGDYTLSSTSPCVEAGDPGQRPSGLDADGNSRFLDGDLDRVPVADMGAFEFTNLRLEVFGDPRPGGSLTLVTTGTPGLSTRMLASIDQTEALLMPFGNSFIDFGGVWLLLPWPSVPSSVDLSLSPSFPAPLSLTLQQLALANRAGNLSNPVFLEIED